ncbi:MAG: ATP-dependent DNA helicase [Chloroflexi bacterium]|nr:ATP-dependent DNA helicase [Chloroflexota bacterium]MXW29111.1 ATP-dependent DNA helicase [Chloroflexota bacterium]MXX99491.1 ATP-dependent DNA helicase [Chloroflexota bacterium]MYC47208.1 ATP-dependent DNA helicase [Chloroflexota bacterium]
MTDAASGGRIPSGPDRHSGVGALFAPGGAIARTLGGTFEPRPGQARMAEAVADAIAGEQVLLVEAGTGTGKTFAYIAPGLMARKRMVIATGTRALQDQLVGKDLPQITAALGLPALAVVNLKGASNYLCKFKFAQLRTGQLELEMGTGRPNSLVLRQIGEWSEETATGDFAELTGVSPDDPLLSSIDGSGDMCHGQRCELYSECHVTKVRREAAEADVIVTNQALYLAGISPQPGAEPLLPAHDLAVIDEAHQLEGFASSAFSIEVSRSRWRRIARNLRTASQLSGTRIPAGGGLDNAADPFFNRLERYVRDVAGGADDGPYRRQVVIDAAAHEGFVGFISEAAAGLISTIDAMKRSLEERIETENSQFDPLIPVASNLLAQHEALHRLLDDPDPEWVLHLQPDRQGRYALLSTPLSVGPILEAQMFGPTRPATAVTLTSATLATAHGFGFTRERLGIGEADELALESPFDHERQALLYVPRDLPPPAVGDERGALAPVVDQIVDLISASDGGVFVLCTSRRRMLQYHELVAERAAGRTFLLQGRASPAALISRFRRERNAVLFATKSFWQGVDIPGRALSMVIVDRLPFPSPAEPVFAARCRAIDAEGRSSFIALSLPLAAMDLKQGFGRLIRSRRDRGVLALLEDRILTRRYGRFLLDALPAVPVTREISKVRAHLARTRGQS